jgi:OmpA-OmpF porin, OOP family
MKDVKLLLAGLLAAMGVALSPSLHAQMSMSGFYAGVGVGQSHASDACEGASALGFSCDDKDTAWRIFGGYQFHKNFALELGYADLGKAHGSGVVLGTPISVDVKAKAWDLVAVGILPVMEQLSLHGKLGFARWDVDASANATGIGSASASDNGTDLTYGVGAQYDFTKQVGMRLEWQQYKDVGDDNTTGKSDVDVISASVLFKF